MGDPAAFVTFDFLQWLLGGAAVLAVVLCGWIARLFAWIARRLDRMEAREQERELQQQKAAERAEDRVENDIRDLWQALEAHRQETRAAASAAQQARERIVDKLGTIEIGLARLHVPGAAPCSPAPID